MKSYILYADDDDDDFYLLKQAFSEVHPEIELINVHSGYDVIKFLQDKTPESFPGVILLDMKMPLLDGGETIELLKLDDRLKKIPVVILSGRNASAKADLSSKVSEIITKPSKYEEWINIARRLEKYCPLLLFAIGLKKYF
jgi:CheY-like chemotaxis protein